MALQLYRRHTSKCSGKRPRHDRAYRRCKCPIHAEGNLRIEGFIRKGTGETEWDQAEARKRLWEDAGTTEAKPVEKPAGVTLEAACTSFFADAKARNLTPPSPLSMSMS